MSWKLEKKKLKNYPHFDAPLSIKDAELIANNRDLVAENAFYPFLRYDESWQPYRSPEKGTTDRPKRKSRPISYCARRDAYIFMRYREILSAKYEERLQEYRISDVPIAYRKIPRSKTNPSGKCNIDFAKDVIDEIKSLGDCVAIALDIKGYFDNLDHGVIRKNWCNLLNVDDLEADHEAVWRAITRYTYVNAKDAYRRLGFFGPKGENGSGPEGYLKKKSEIPKQLCSPREFRAIILGKGGAYPSLVRKNWKPRGIPQGSPISDVIANFYLLDFDREMASHAKSLGGSYRRYSDDILFLIPSGSVGVQDIEMFASKRIMDFGDHLVIKSAKTSVLEFRRLGERQIYSHQSGEQGANGLEYLGFRYDGTEVFIRDSTISRYFRKIALAAKAEARYLVNKYPGQTKIYLMSKLNMSLLLQRWDRVLKFRAVKNEPRKWTFRTYAKRAAQTFENGDIFLKQLSSTKVHLRSRVEQALDEILK